MRYRRSCCREFAKHKRVNECREHSSADGPTENSVHGDTNLHLGVSDPPFNEETPQEGSTLLIKVPSSNGI